MLSISTYLVQRVSNYNNINIQSKELGNYSIVTARMQTIDVISATSALSK